MVTNFADLTGLKTTRLVAKPVNVKFVRTLNPVDALQILICTEHFFSNVGARERLDALGKC